MVLWFCSFDCWKLLPFTAVWSPACWCCRCSRCRRFRRPRGRGKRHHRGLVLAGLNRVVVQAGLDVGGLDDCRCLFVRRAVGLCRGLARPAGWPVVCKAEAEAPTERCSPGQARRTLRAVRVRVGYTSRQCEQQARCDRTNTSFHRFSPLSLGVCVQHRPLPPGLTQGELRNAVPAYPPPAPAQWPDEAIYRSVRLEALLAVGGLARSSRSQTCCDRATPVWAGAISPNAARPERSSTAKLQRGARRSRRQRRHRSRHPGAAAVAADRVGRSPAAARRTAPRRSGAPAVQWSARQPPDRREASRTRASLAGRATTASTLDVVVEDGVQRTAVVDGPTRRRQLGYLPGLPGGGLRLPPVRQRARRWP